MTRPSAQEQVRRRRDLRVEVPGATLRTVVEGAGRDLLLVHGLSAHAGEWEAVATRLAGRFRVLTPDLAGRGRSPARRDARFRLAEETERLVALLAALGSQDPIVAGHSHGAALAVALAGRVSCRALLLLNPVTPWTPRPRALDVLRLPGLAGAAARLLRPCRAPLTRYILSRRVYADAGRATEEAVARYAGPLAAPERARELVRVLADWHPSELAPFAVRAGLPVHVVAGRHDRRIPTEAAAEWARRLGARFTVLEDCAHGIPEEAPARVAEYVLALDASAPPVGPE